MTKTVTFTGAVLKSFSRADASGSAKFSCNYTQTVKEAMEWGDAAEYYKSGKLDGDLTGRKMTIRPSDGPLEKFTIEVDITSVYGFELTRYEIEGKRGKGHRWELHFTVDFNDPTGCRYLEEFKVNCGKGKASITISHEPQAKQDSLPGTELDSKQSKLPEQ